jgi:glycogen debranching enzyme
MFCGSVRHELSSFNSLPHMHPSTPLFRNLRHPKVAYALKLLATLCLSLAFANAGPLPPRFPLTPPDPVIRKPAQPHHFLESVGRRAAILGAENGTFEAWLNPIKVLRDFRFSVYFDGALEPVDLSELAEHVAVSPGRVTITHSHAAFTIRQTWVAAVDQPALLVLLDIDTDRPLRLRAAFIPEMKPMWPASFGGQSSSWDENDKALVLGEGLRRYSMLVGSPLFSKHSEQVGHQLPGRTVLLEMDLTPQTCRDRLIPVVIAGSRQAYAAALDNVEKIVRESGAYYQAFASRTTHVYTPDATLNDAIAWATFAIEKGWACNESVGCGLVAGYAPSGESERPGFAWYFGGDALMNSWSIVDYGDFDRARAVLEFVRDHQRTDGKIEHELTQSAALVDWSKYPYGYYHADTTPLYVFSAARYVRRSGDTAFLRASWPSIERAYRYCVSVVDEDGLLSNRKAGAGAVETGALSGRVANDIYLQGVWLAALDGYISLAKVAGKPYDDASRRLQQARETVNGWFIAAKNTFAFARLTDGSMYDAQSAWQGFALAYGGLDQAHSAAAAAHLARPEMATNWGLRLFATDSPYYDPLSYNDGSVWPFVTSFAILGEYSNHQPDAALRHLHGTAAMTGLTAAGFIPEYMSGERAQALPHAVPHQLFSSSSVIDSTISGLLGLDGDAIAHTLTIAPHIPQGWTIRFDNYRVGASTVSGEIARSKGRAEVSLSIAGDPLSVTISPSFEQGASLLRATVDGSPSSPTVEKNTSDIHITLHIPTTSHVQCAIDAGEPAHSPPLLPDPRAGDRARGDRGARTRACSVHTHVNAFPSDQL